MNEMKLFENPEFGAIRTVEVGGEPWLVGKDVAQALGYSDTSDALKRHVDPEDNQPTRVYRLTGCDGWPYPSQSSTVGGDVAKSSKC